MEAILEPDTEVGLETGSTDQFNWEILTCLLGNVNVGIFAKCHLNQRDGLWFVDDVIFADHGRRSVFVVFQNLDLDVRVDLFQRFRIWTSGIIPLDEIHAEADYFLQLF